MIVDSHGRVVRYMRLSVTDRCNLRCFYCRSCEDLQSIPHDHILTYEEMLSLAKAAQQMKVEKLRLTGGEPFVRRDFLAFLGMLREDCPDLDVRITTNATLLSGKVPALKHLGVKRVNISLDTMSPAKFQEITGRDMFDRVRQGIDDCLHYGLKVKINVVAVRGVNDDELPAFLDFARTHPVDVRFIEFMPIGCATRWKGSSTWKSSEILADATKYATLEPLPRSRETDGPARMFSIKDGQGHIGLISPLTNHFCDTCNRLRITSDGKLRTCLFSDKEFNLRKVMRHPKLGPEAALRVMRLAAINKPIGHELLRQKINNQVCNKVMSSIGG
ncbi:GTP 3',8-cyclase MoaA [Desulfovibrio ferrophilus]|uniref:GTP 3',8-cyclase n=1 Tax=Desulfovibrio ferrophilus TaxID=241368 RepID=A0A2Z6AVU1_9BACT|nr:GTP 3',8-cyclase MoaA [Desulfovibrio ferrophilus]BBD07357.1 cyclic pyranopterin monophosphate synthase [Desulfovibrio ferrophilus]